MTKLESDDIEVGQYVTVLEWKPRIQQVNNGGLFGMGGGVETITHHDSSGVGEVFTVKAVDRPFVALVSVGHPTWRKEPWTVDTRRCTLKRLSDEFVAAVLPKADGTTGGRP